MCIRDRLLSPRAALEVLQNQLAQKHQAIPSLETADRFIDLKIQNALHRTQQPSIECIIQVKKNQSISQLLNQVRNDLSEDWLMIHLFEYVPMAYVKASARFVRRLIQREEVILLSACA